MQLEDDLLYKLSSAEGDMTEDLALIESLEESKRVADEISEKVAEAKTTEEQINEARNKVPAGMQCMKPWPHHTSLAKPSDGAEGLTHRIGPVPEQPCYRQPDQGTICLRQEV